MDKKIFRFPPTLLTIKTKREMPIIRWRSGEGLSVTKEPAEFRFPPTLLELEFRTGEKGEKAEC